MIKYLSPCIGVCKLDIVVNDIVYCIGCNRTKEEIFEWLHYTEEERLQKMKELKERYFDIGEKDGSREKE